METERQLHEDSRRVETHKELRLVHILGKTHNANYPLPCSYIHTYLPTYVHHHPTPRFSLVIFASSPLDRPIRTSSPSRIRTSGYTCRLLLFGNRGRDCLPTYPNVDRRHHQLAWRNPAQPHAKVKQSRWNPCTSYLLYLGPRRSGAT